MRLGAELPPRRRTLVGSLLVAAALLVPFNVEEILTEYGRFSDVHHRTSIFLFDWPLALLAVVLGWTLVRDPPIRALIRSSAGAGAWLAGVFAMLTVVAVLFHPSARGVQVLARLVVTLAVPAVALVLLDVRWVRRVEGALLAGAVFQTGVAVAQVWGGETVGLTFLGENPPLSKFGAWVAAKGTFVHSNSLASFAAVAVAVAARRCWSRPSLPAAALVAVVAAPLGLADSRMGLLAAAAVVVALGTSRAASQRRAALVTAAAVAVGVGVPAVVTLDSWRERAEVTTGVSRGVDVVATGRVSLARDAVDLIRDQPFVGVGPGRYVLELEERKDVPRGVEVQPVHNVPLLVAAENGVPSAVVLGLALVLLGLHAWRRGPPARALYAAYLPFLFFDVLPYGNVQGLALTGFWLGLLAVAGGRRDHVPVEDPTAAHATSA